VLLSVCKCRTRYWIFIRHVTCDLEHHPRIHYQFSCINFQIFYTTCTICPLIISYYFLCPYIRSAPNQRFTLDAIMWCLPVDLWWLAGILLVPDVSKLQLVAVRCHTRQAMAPHCILEGLPNAANNCRLRCLCVCIPVNFERIKKHTELK